MSRSTISLRLKEPTKGHQVANYLQKPLAPEAIAKALGNNYYVCEGSPGKGVWADVPWIAVYNPTVTTSATRGYYVVYLFYG